MGNKESTRDLNQDWNGDGHSIFLTLGASNHVEGERPNDDYYSTDPKAAELLLEIENIPKDKPIWECAAGGLALSNVFKKHGYEVRSTDIHKRGIDEIEVLDFLEPPLFDQKIEAIWDGTIITNPPYKYAQEFVERALEYVTDGNKVCMFLKILFLEGKKRRKLFEQNPPRVVWVSSSRLGCYKNGNVNSYDNSSAVAYAWFVWEKGYKGETVVKWFN